MMAKFPQVADAIAADIDAGVLKPGDRLPSELELGARHKVGRTTVRAAIDLLRERGLVQTVHAKGTYVTAVGKASAPVPPSRRLVEDLRDAITSGRLRPGDPLPPEQQPLHCGRCAATMRRALLVVDELTASWAARPGVVRAQTRWSRVKGTRPHGSLSGEGDVVHTLTGELLRLRRDVGERLELADLVPGSRSGVVRSRSVSWLVDKLDAVLGLDGLAVVSSVEDEDRPVELGVVDWALAWESRLRRLVDDEPGATLARCPGCGLRRLEWPPRAGYYVCENCGHHVSEQEAMDRVTEEAGA
ncbi:GntR family transcriptional regulator [Nonomuraea turkmeniaca]|uniref:GntR family transcriptional regulator n=1 Tax=Nonomuraea turkmeniaca TaxID=103838 RepID=A0A5S4FM57_9ACTN|nr:GntR family transcriptional regulator [Nonomuraea turkmeniaca]TMR10237.1 GntR family transcriptional regulator [Nonomuraea turkmeniaca]